MVTKDIVFINKKSNIAIATLWTKKESIIQKLKNKNKVNVAGTLYSTYGINYLLHTLASNPQIDTIILFGADLSGVGDVLKSVFENKALGEVRLIWSINEIGNVLETVKIVDLRDAYNRSEWQRLEETVEKFYNPRGPVRPLINLELKEMVADSWPLPVSGFFIHEISPFRAWLKAIYAVMKFGNVKECEYGERQKQILNLVITLNFYGREIIFEEEFFKYISEEMFTEHYRSIVDFSKYKGVTYTYGERLFAHPFAGNQYGMFIEKLRKCPETRRALAVLWHHKEDIENENPPCIVIIQGDVTGQYYNHTVYIRSNDMYTAWPINVYGQVRLAEKIAKELGLKIGTITTISSSAHVYEHDWDNAWNLLHEHYDKLVEFVPDSRGSYILYLSGSELVVEHRTPEGLKANELRLKSFRDYYVLKRESLYLTPEHAFYLGWESRKALERLSKKEKYVQDDDFQPSR